MVSESDIPLVMHGRQLLIHLAHYQLRRDFGMPYAVALRIGLNAAGAAYTWLCDKVLERIHSAVQAKNASVVE